MVNNVWAGTKVRLRAILPEDWERFHDNDEDSDGARECDVIHFPRSEEGTRFWTEQEAAASRRVIITALRLKRWMASWSEV